MTLLHHQLGPALVVLDALTGKGETAPGHQGNLSPPDGLQDEANSGLACVHGGYKEPRTARTGNLEREAAKLETFVSTCRERIDTLIAACSAGIIDLGELKQARERIASKQRRAVEELAGLGRRTQANPRRTPAEHWLAEKTLEIVANSSDVVTDPPEARSSLLLGVSHNLTVQVPPLGPVPSTVSRQ